jgi:cell wall-associated NlpC family hydrolase
MMIIVKDLIGIPYKPHGRDKNGMDCYGIVIEVLRRKGITVADVFYPDTALETNKYVLQILVNSIPNTRLEIPEEGAVVEILVYGQPSHVGVCLGDGTFIHALKRIGVVIEPLSRYQHKIKGYYRVNN